MKNPCKDCIVKVNCTEVCFEKKNYQALLNDAITKHRGRIWDKQSRRFYRLYDSENLQCRIDISNINNRRKKIGRGQ